MNSLPRLVGNEELETITSEKFNTLVLEESDNQRIIKVKSFDLGYTVNYVIDSPSFTKEMQDDDYIKATLEIDKNVLPVDAQLDNYIALKIISDESDIGRTYSGSISGSSYSITTHYTNVNKKLESFFSVKDHITLESTPTSTNAIDLTRESSGYKLSTWGIDVDKIKALEITFMKKSSIRPSVYSTSNYLGSLRGNLLNISYTYEAEQATGIFAVQPLWQCDINKWTTANNNYTWQINDSYYSVGNEKFLVEVFNNGSANAPIYFKVDSANNASLTFSNTQLFTYSQINVYGLGWFY